MLEILGIASLIFVIMFTWWQAKKATTLGQSPRESIIEAWTNIVIGFTLNFIINIPMIPLMAGQEHHIPLINNWWGGWVFTVVSIIRQYTIRRFFNSYVKDFQQWLMKLV